MLPTIEKLSDDSLYFIKEYKSYLLNNDIEGFFEQISKVSKQHHYRFESELIQYMIEHGIDILSYMTKIPDDFLKVYPLKHLTIPDNIKSIGVRGLYYSLWLETVYIPDSVQSIGEKCFCGCEHLVNCRLSESITEIPSCCFEDCKSMKDLHIPSSVIKIAKDAFNGCSADLTLSVDKSNVNLRRTLKRRGLDIETY